MTRYLLDTCVAVWATQSPRKLSEHARKVLLDGDSERVVSVVSAWEIAQKVKAGELKLSMSLDRWFADALQALGAEELPMSAASCEKLLLLPEIHADLFDRMLISQAIAEGLTIVTPHPQVRLYPLNSLW